MVSLGKFGDIVVHFNILDAMKHPSEDQSVFRAEIIDQIVNDYMFGYLFGTFLFFG